MSEIKELPRSGETSRADAARQIIFDHAIDLFDKKGFRATSMNEIAQACGVSKPAIYHYFKNKSHLLETLYESNTHDFFGSMEKLAHSPLDPPTKLRRLIEEQTLYNIRNSRFLTIFWRERHELEADSREALAGLEREFETWVLHILADGTADGSFAPPVPPGDLRTQMLAILALLSTVHRWAAYAGTPPEAIARTLGDLVLTGMARVAEA